MQHCKGKPTRTTKPLQKCKREEQEGIRQAEWTSSNNPMVTVKPRIKKNNVENRPGYNLEFEDGLHSTHPRVPGEA
jgi:hypothetical protein